MKAEDLTGRRFGKLVAVENVGAHRVYKPNGRVKSTSQVWLCRCDCGRESRAFAQNLRSGNSASCGCAFRPHPKHGQARRGAATPEYRTWMSIHRRCKNQNTRDWPLYGGRGICVCERWSGGDGFANFLADMGERPSDGHSIDRVDADGPYAPENCRWASAAEQAKNKRTSRRVEIGGATELLSDLAARAGMRTDVVARRLGRGWPLARALSAPLRTRRAA